MIDRKSLIEIWKAVKWSFFFQAFVIYFLYENFEKEHSRKSW